MLRLRLRKVPIPGGYCLLRIAKEELSLERDRGFECAEVLSHRKIPSCEKQIKNQTGKYRDTQSPTPHA